MFGRLGYTAVTDIVHDSLRKIDICFLEKDGYMVELISPTDKDSVAAGLLKKYKNSPYHICYETPNLERDLALLAGDGFTAIDTPTPAPALGDRRVVFLMNASIGMIELLETGTTND